MANVDSINSFFSMSIRILSSGNLVIVVVIFSFIFISKLLQPVNFRAIFAPNCDRPALLFPRVTPAAQVPCAAGVGSLGHLAVSVSYDFPKK